MSNTSSFPSETLLLYQSKPTEILATENVAQASTAGQWVGDKGCPVKETSHFPTLQNSHSSKKKRMWTHLLWFSEASRQCHFLVPDPIPLSWSTLEQETTVLCAMTELRLESALTSLLLYLCWLRSWAASAELVKMMSYVRLIFWKWKSKSLRKTRMPCKAQRNAANIILLYMRRLQL